MYVLRGVFGFPAQLGGLYCILDSFLVSLAFLSASTGMAHTYLRCRAHYPACGRQGDLNVFVFILLLWFSLLNEYIGLVNLSLVCISFSFSLPLFLSLYLSLSLSIFLSPSALS